MSKDLAQNQTEWDLHDAPEAFIPLEFTEEIKPDLFGLEVAKATEMVSGLSVTIAERKVLENAYIDVIGLEINAENLNTFKELRLKIVKNRTQGLDVWKKNEKAFFLAGGNFVDAVYKKELAVNSNMEAKLMEAEKFFDNQEKEKKRLINFARLARLKPYIEDTTRLDFSEMNDYDFDDYVLGKKTRFENEAKEREERAEIEEKRRLTEIERQIAISKENDKLKSDAEAKEKALEKERADAKVIADKLKANAEKIAKELQDKKDAEEKAETERLSKIELEKADAENLAKAPIKKQLSVWVESFELPHLRSESEKAKEIKEKFEAFKKWSINQINNL